MIEAVKQECVKPDCLRLYPPWVCEAWRFEVLSSVNAWNLKGLGLYPACVKPKCWGYPPWEREAWVFEAIQRECVKPKCLRICSTWVWSLHILDYPCVKPERVRLYSSWVCEAWLFKALSNVCVKTWVFEALSNVSMLSLSIWSFIQRGCVKPKYFRLYPMWVCEALVFETLIQRECVMV